MVFSIEEILTLIEVKILSTFPTLNVSVFKRPDENEYFVAIDDDEIYYSNLFQKLIFDININHVWQEGISNIYFIAAKNNSFSSINLKIGSATDENLTYESVPSIEYPGEMSSQIDCFLSKAA